MPKHGFIQKIHIICVLVGMYSVPALAYDITFCDEPIPVHKDFVANKLMNVIRRQMPYVNIASLRNKAMAYFPGIEACLRKNGIPEDFKYLPIVECGFNNTSSTAGARGFWQLMPGVAREFGMKVTAQTDDRDDPYKSTDVACKLISRNYKNIRSQINASSWILTAAAYNFGIGNVIKLARRQGTDYFSMNLNAETAEYVYKIIAVKELFENPELYMNSFGSNIFARKAATPASEIPVNPAPKAPVGQEFSSIEVKISKEGKVKPAKPVKITYVAAHITERYPDLQDGDLIALQLDDDLVLQSDYIKNGNIVKGAAWIIDDRVYIDMGYGHDVQVIDDEDGKKGIPLSSIQKGNSNIILKTAGGDDG